MILRQAVFSFFLTVALTASAQEVSNKFQKMWSVEIGTGVQPLHMTLSPSREVEKEFANQGQTISGEGSFYPVMDITGVLRTAPRHEFTLSAGASWYHHRLYQHAAFGIDPNGNLRYSLEDKTLMDGWKDSSPIFSLTFHWRFIWNPDDAVTVYSGLGLGLVTTDIVSPVPSVIPIAFRYGGRHFYFFLENMLGPMATLAHGGLGWRF